jgi:hypothetical protein
VGIEYFVEPGAPRTGQVSQQIIAPATG